MSNITYISNFFIKQKFITNTNSRRYKHSIFNLFKNKQFFQRLETNQIFEDNLFHRLSQSPIQSLREKANTIKKYAKCPISDNPIFFECPNCGYPTHHSELEWKIDNEHEKFCKKLREINEDEHYLHSKKELYDLSFPESQFKDATINFQSWYSFFHTRSFETVNSPRSIRYLSKILTYPLTLLSIIHEGSPYNIKNGLTLEGLKSLLAIRYILHEHPKNINSTSKNILDTNNPFRIFVLGARAESTLPKFLWMQSGANLFPNILFHIHFIGPEVSITNKLKNYNNTRSTFMRENFNSNLTFSTYSEYYHILHEKKEFEPFNPYYDIFYLPNSGIGHPNSSSWYKTIEYLLETQCSIFITGCSLKDIQQDFNFIEEKYKNKYDILLNLTENRFKSNKWDVSEKYKNKYDILLNLTENRFKSNKWDVSVFDPRDIIQTNAYIAGFRGKKYEIKSIN
ncbi:hypothetical protein PORY_002285 [Pneumocystis oryctolagi]|uniref:Uncharacterized protein n=1 Tax=Pneumocystis oryctolagi TaxID=42067 RepID=A0ACB7CA22_9ASCO|nr:hypothetical protein PORY_002285 [Pneumocystis oryctolagi]